MLPSGLKVASVDSDATAISTVGLLVKSGPSYESYDILGASHAIRLNVGMATRNATAFGIVRSVQQAGGSIDVLGSREYTLYSMSLPRHLMVDNFDFLHEAVTAPAFKPWEQRDNVHKRMALEVASVDGPTKAVELLHKAAYRFGHFVALSVAF
jgi:predicted Zn-dependent peptidase